jgi:hypothetical protein
LRFAALFIDERPLLINARWLMRVDFINLAVFDAGLVAAAQTAGLIVTPVAL